MTIREALFNVDYCKKAHSDAHFFEATDLNGIRHIMCWASFLFAVEVSELTEEYPGLMKWEVTKDDLTEDAIKGAA